jgi:hypothetical protein
MTRKIPIIRVLVIILMMALGFMALYFGYRAFTFDHAANSIAENLLETVLLTLWISLPIAAVVRLVAAPFSQSVRNSIMRHKVVHVVWLLAALLTVFMLIAPILFAPHTKGGQ